LIPPTNPTGEWVVVTVKPPLNAEVDVYYHKSNFFRVVRADGCYGGPTPRGILNLSFYSERQAIPLRTKLKVENGTVLPEAVVETKGGLVRELEVDVTMDFQPAVSFYVWYKQKIQELRLAVGVSDDDWKNMTGEG